MADSVVIILKSKLNVNGSNPDLCTLGYQLVGLLASHVPRVQLLCA